MYKQLSKKISADAIGISASLICAIHCAVLPLFLSSLPIFGFEILKSKLFEYSMIGFAAAIGCYALFHGYKKHHHKKLPLCFFLAGIFLLVLKEIFVTVEMWLIIPAATSIVFAHVLNFRLCRKAIHYDADDCDHANLLS